MSLLLVLFSALLISQGSAHGLINEIQGATGAASAGFGVNIANPSRNDVAVLSSKTGCGSGVDIAAGISAAEAAILPKVSSSGTLNMNWLQFNAGSDGGGPGAAFVDVTGTGNSFVSTTITKNFADGGANSNNAMTIQLDSSLKCTGGSGATCLVKVQNPAGPFGSCFAVASPSGGSAAGGSASAGSASASSASATTVAATSAKANTASSTVATTTATGASATSANAAGAPTVTVTVDCSGSSLPTAQTAASGNIAAATSSTGSGAGGHKGRKSGHPFARRQGKMETMKKPRSIL